MMNQEKQAAMKKLGSKPEITRFKGLGEISPEEFARFIGRDIKLQPVMLTCRNAYSAITGILHGENTQERQEFIIDNLKVEVDLVDETVIAEK
jgi:topoisomerase-4 subunit B